MLASRWSSWRLLTLLGAAYMSVGVLDMSPTKQVTRLTLMLNTSGGLMPTSEVTMRGIKVGRVTGIQTTTSGLAVSMDLDRAHPVPADSAVSVENLSAAGEQYIEFKPKLIAPPYFSRRGSDPRGPGRTDGYRQ